MTCGRPTKRSPALPVLVRRSQATPGSHSETTAFGIPWVAEQQLLFTVRESEPCSVICSPGLRQTSILTQGGERGLSPRGDDEREPSPAALLPIRATVGLGERR